MGNDPVMVGWGHTRFGQLDWDLETLIHASAQEAIADSGVDAREIDAVWLGHFNSGMVADAFCSSMVLGAHPGLRYKPATRCENACASGSAALYGALDAIRSGRVRLALVVGVEKMTALSTAGVTKALSGAGYQAEERELSFPQILARYAKAYTHAYEDPTEALARISVKNHANAMRNPLAQMHRPYELDFCLQVSERNPMIADPLKLSDCSLITDGAAAIVVVRQDMAHLFRRGVGFRATEQVNDVLRCRPSRLQNLTGRKRLSGAPMPRQKFPSTIWILLRCMTASPSPN